jgi:Tfp pilus assembly protein PilO
MKIAFLQHLPKDKLQKIVLVGVVTLIVVVGVLQLYVVQNWTEWRATKAKIAQRRDQIQEAERKAAQAHLHEATRREMEAFVQAQQKTLVTGDPFAWVVREISLFAEQRPVRVASLRPGTKGEPVRKSRYASYTTRLEVTGQFDQIAQFIRDLENQFPTATIRSLTWVGDTSGRQEHQVSFDLVLLMGAPTNKSEGKTS